MNATILPGPGTKTRPPSPRGGDRHNIQSVDRALFLLETIAEAGGEATLTELANRTGLNISTCHHLLATLIQARLRRQGAGPSARMRSALAFFISGMLACRSICRAARSLIWKR